MAVAGNYHSLSQRNGLCRRIQRNLLQRLLIREGELGGLVALHGEGQGVGAQLQLGSKLLLVQGDGARCFVNGIGVRVQFRAARNG